MSDRGEGSVGPAGALRRRLGELTELGEELLEREPIRAREVAAEGVELSERLGDRGYLARNLYVLGSAELTRGGYESAESDLRRSLDLADEGGQSHLMVDVLRALLRCAFLTRNPDAALLRGLQALQLAKQSDDRERQARTHNDLGLVYGNLGDFEGALEHLLAGLRLGRETGSNRQGSLLNNIGNVYLELDDPAEALTFFTSARESFREEGTPRGEGIALGNIGRACSALGDPEAAADAYEESLRIYEGLGDGAYTLAARARYATGIAALGREMEADATFKDILEEIDRSNHREFEDEILAAAAKFHLATNRHPEAIRLLRRVLDVVPPDEVTRRVYEAHRALADAYEQIGDIRAAYHHFKHFQRIRQEVSDGAVTIRIRGLMLQFDVERARQQEEIFRLRNVELAQANRELQELQSHLEATNRELHQISIEDALTGLHNRRYLDMQIGVEISRSLRHERTLCVAMIDIDHFKEANDRYSHAIGDAVLRQLAEIFRERARASDIVVRYGGEEFVLILPDTDLAGAESFSERIRAMVAQHPWSRVAPGLSVTLSIGVAELEPGQDAAALLAAADSRLYEAKRGGRDRVVA